MDGIEPGSTLGGQRDLSLSVDGPDTNTASASLSEPLGPGADDDAMVYTTSDSGSFTLTTDAGGDLSANFLDIPDSDTPADWDRIRVDFGAGSSAAEVVVNLFSSENGGMFSLAQDFMGGDNNLDFLHSSFVGDDDGSLTPEFLRNVDRAAFTVNAPGASEFTIESFNRNGFVAEGDANAVPGPNGLGLLGLGLAMLGYTTLRRKSKG